jgi:D-3-phosphoglycerate dehydrogenase / 2-oxoglutarate reductase
VKKILVTSRSFGTGERALLAEMEEAGFEVLTGPPHHAVGELRSQLGEAEGWIAGTGGITKEHLDLAPHLKVIARYGVGTEAVDLAAATQRNIVVTNTPGANSNAVADLAIGLMLEGLRHISAGDRNLRLGNWEALPGRELGAITVGIVGFGRVGQEVARRLAGFGSRLIAYDPYADASVFSTSGVAAVDLESLIAESDVITLHAPGGQVLIDTQSLRRTKPHTVIVNTARADLVDESAVANALRTGHLGAYVADVLHGDTEGSSSPLLADDVADRVTLTPHIAAHTVQAIDLMGSMAWANIHAVLSGGEPPNPVHPLPEAGA